MAIYYQNGLGQGSIISNNTIINATRDGGCSSSSSNVAYKCGAGIANTYATINNNTILSNVLKIKNRDVYISLDERINIEKDKIKKMN